MNSDCVFCKIVAHEVPSTIDYEDDSIIAFRNIKPVASTHILITPKKHITSFMDFDDSTLSLQMIKVAQTLIKENKIEGGYKLVFNGGKYQEIPHMHWHLLGGKMKRDE